MLCETTRLTLPDIWRRIYHLPNANELFTRIKTHASKGNSGNAVPDSFFNQVLSTSVLDVGVNGGTSTLPGGVLQIGQNANLAAITPQIAVDTVAASISQSRIPVPAAALAETRRRARAIRQRPRATALEGCPPQLR